MKILFTYGSNTKEGFTPYVPGTTDLLVHESVEEIAAEDVIGKVPNLIKFVEECYRLLRPEGKLTCSAPHYSSSLAWTSPLTVRGIAESSLNFASKDWREQSKFTDATINANFEVAGNFVVDQETLARSDDAKQFWMKRYSNVVQSVILCLTKK